MGQNQSKISTLVVAFILMFVSTGNAQSAQQERHVRVAMRMIGHQILLDANDSTSLVLPIEKEDDRYKIQFQSEFEFDPEKLIATVSSVLEENKIENGYVVEVESYETGEVVYSFDTFAIKDDTLNVCSTRVLPKAGYLVFLAFDGDVVPGTFNADGDLVSSDETFADRRSQRNWTIVIALFLLVGVLFLVRKVRGRSKLNSDIIQLGEYQFDKRKTELIIEDQRIELTSKEADLLMVLYNTVNETVEREVILNRVWGDEGDYVGRTLDVFVSKLRKKLEGDASVKIVNIRGVGYKLVTDS